MVPMNQSKRTLIEAMFNTQTKFKDSIFYDVSSWTFPLAFNVNYDYTDGLSQSNISSLIGDEVNDLVKPIGDVYDKSDYAYIFEPHEYYTQAAIYKILDKGLRVKTATRKFSINGKEYDYGTYMIPVQSQQLNSDEIYKLLNKVSKEYNVDFESHSTGITDGIDFGSNDFIIVRQPKIGLIVGDGVRSYDAGEVWHLLDVRFDIPITKIDVGNLREIDLNKYSHIILPDYVGSRINANQIKEYVNDGGNLIAYRNSIKWVSNNIDEIELISNSLVAKGIAFDEREAFLDAQETGGAIFKSNIDKSHPINYGIESSSLPLFRNSNVYMTKDQQSYNNPILYTSDPLISGYVSEENLSLVKESSPFKLVKRGKGKILLMTDNTNFRAFWFGTNRILLNMLFHSNIM